MLVELTKNKVREQYCHGDNLNLMKSIFPQNFHIESLLQINLKLY